MTKSRGAVVALALLGGVAGADGQVLPPAPAGVQVTNEYGIEFATVGHAGNAGIPINTLAAGPIIPTRSAT